MKRYIISIGIAILLMFTMFTIEAQALEFNDVSEGSWYHNFIQYANEKGWVQGYGNGLFGPEDTLTYAQALTIIVRSTGLTPTPDNDYWYSGFVKAAKDAKYIDKDYDWNSPISRLDMAKIIINAYDIEPTTLNKHEIEHGETTTSPFVDIHDDYITSLHNYGIIAGIITEFGLTFQPDKTLTRAEICTMLTRLDTHPVLSEKIKNKNYSTNDHTEGYEYFIERKTTYNTDSSETSNIVDGLLYMVTNDLYEVTFDYQKSAVSLQSRAKEIFNVWLALSYAYPEYFSIYQRYGAMSGYENGHYTITFYAYPRENWTKQEAIAERAKLFKNAKTSIDELISLGLIRDDMNETDKAHAVATWIVNNAQYDITYSDESHYGSDFYNDKNLVCEGYTTLYNTMLKYLNINAYGVMGSSKGGNHMWSINHLDGEWKYTDVTHMDPIDMKNPTKPYFNDEYFNRTEEEMLELNNTRKTKISYLEQIEEYGIESWNI